MIKKLTLCYSYYNQPHMLKKQFEVWCDYPENLRKKIRIILVDDCSKEPAKIQDCGIEISVFRVVQDIEWNWDGARNLAMYHAEGWCIITDLDHILHQDQALAILNSDLEKGHYYQPKRMRDGEFIHSHCNSFLIHNKTYWRVGGYDEALLGYRKDCWFRKRLTKIVKHGNTDAYLEVVLPNKIIDSAVSLLRDDRTDDPGERYPLVLSFEWERIV